MEKIYCGSGKTRSGQYGSFESVSLCLDDIPAEHITTASNGKRYVNITVSKKKEVDKYGKDLSVTVDTWKPEGKQDQTASQAPSKPVAQVSEDELPF